MIKNMKIYANILYALTAILASLLLAGCSNNEAIEEEVSEQLAIDVVETGWQGETVSITTRAGETLEGLRDVANPASPADGEGFGIYCSDLNYTNTQVVWDNTNGRWKIGEHDYRTYWKSNEAGTINVYAYAPYKKHNPSAIPPSPTYTVADNKLTFVAQKHSFPGYTTQLSGGNVDLLQASASISRSSNNPAQFNFTHKLAKLTFGTITNNTGETIQLNGFTVSGTINSEAKLDLTNGGWSGHVSSTTSIQLPPPFVYVVHTPAEMAGPPPDGYAAKALIEPLLDKQTVLPNMAMGRSVLLIPNGNGEITVTVEVNNSTGETFSFPITLEEGKEKIVNITIGRNFEVVIE